jgi:hypothetical protein
VKEVIAPMASGVKRWVLGELGEREVTERSATAICFPLRDKNRCIVRPDVGLFVLGHLFSPQSSLQQPAQILKM